MNENQELFPLETNFKKLHWRVVWTHKIHAAFLEHLVRINFVIKIIKYVSSSILSALTIVSAVFLSTGWTIASASLTAVSVLAGLILENIYSDKRIETQKSNVDKLCKMRDRIELEIDAWEYKVKHEEAVQLSETKEKYSDLRLRVDEIEATLEVVSRKYVDIADKRLNIENDEGMNENF